MNNFQEFGHVMTLLVWLINSRDKAVTLSIPERVHFTCSNDIIYELIDPKV